VERGAPPPDLSGAHVEAPLELPSADRMVAGPVCLISKPRSAQATPEERRFNRFDRNRDGKITRVEMLSTRVKAFQKLDTNHDNLLTFEEWAVKTSDRFKAVDRDGDGIISRDELNAFTRRRRRRSAAGCSQGDAVFVHCAFGGGRRLGEKLEGLRPSNSRYVSRRKGRGTRPLRPTSLPRRGKPAALRLCSMAEPEAQRRQSWARGVTPRMSL
jgi:hypothetical protein